MNLLEQMTLASARFRGSSDSVVRPADPTPPPPSRPTDDDASRRLDDPGTSWIPVQVLEELLRITPAIGFLTVRENGMLVGSASAFAIGPNVIMTANHALPSPQAARESSILFGYTTPGLDRATRDIAVELRPDELFVTNEALDYTVAKTAERSHGREDRPWLRVGDSKGKIVIGECVKLVAHPNGGPKAVSGGDAEVLDILEDFIHYESRRAPGATGAPVLNSQNEVVAMHHSAVPATDERGNWLTRSGAIWGPEGGEPFFVASEGVRASSIATDVVRRAPEMAKYLDLTSGSGDTGSGRRS